MQYSKQLNNNRSIIVVLVYFVHLLKSKITILSRQVFNGSVRDKQLFYFISHSLNYQDVIVYQPWLYRMLLLTNRGYTGCYCLLTMVIQDVIVY